MLFLNGASKDGNVLVSRDASKDSLISVMLKHLSNVDWLLKNRPQLLMSVLSLLKALCDNEEVYSQVIYKISDNQVFWNGLRSILLSSNPLPEISALGEFFEVDPLQSTMHEAVQDYCIRQSMISNAVYIFAMHLLYVTPRDAEPGKKLIEIAEEVFYGGRICHSFLRDCTISFDGGDITVLRRLAKTIESNTDLNECRLPYSPDSYQFQTSFGDSYFYALSLVEGRFSVNLMDTESDQGKLELLSRVCGINHALSLSDSQISLMTSYSLLLRSFSVRLGVRPWLEKNIGAPSVDKVPQLSDFISKLLENLSKESQNTSYVTVMYRNELWRLLILLFKQWKGLFVNSAESETPFRRVIGFVELLHNCLQNDAFPIVGADGIVTGQEFHQSLFACLLILLGKRVFAESPEFYVLAEHVLELFPVVCETLVSLLSFPPVNSETESHRHFLRLSIMLLSEMIHIAHQSKSSIWIRTLDNCGLIRQLLQSLAVCMENALKRDKTGLDALLGYDILHLLRVFSSFPTTAELLAVKGCVAFFSHNSLTPILESGQLAASESDHLPLHRMWCSMLSILDNLLLQLSGSTALFASAAAFLTVYWSQIERALDFSSEPNLTSLGLEETELITKVFSSLMDSKMVNGSTKRECIGRYLCLTRTVIKYHTFLLLHPHLMENKAVGVPHARATIIRILRNVVDCALKSSEVFLLFLFSRLS